MYIDKIIIRNAWEIQIDESSILVTFLNFPEIFWLKRDSFSLKFIQSKKIKK